MMDCGDEERSEMAERGDDDLESTDNGFMGSCAALACCSVRISVASGFSHISKMEDPISLVHRFVLHHGLIYHPNINDATASTKCIVSLIYGLVTSAASTRPTRKDWWEAPHGKAVDQTPLLTTAHSATTGSDNHLVHMSYAMRPASCVAKGLEDAGFCAQKATFYHQTPSSRFPSIKSTPSQPSQSRFADKKNEMRAFA